METSPPIVVDSMESLTLRMPRGWQCDDGTWVDSAEYNLDNEDRLVYTSDYILDEAILRDALENEDAVLAANHGFLPDWSKGRVAEEQDSDIANAVRAALRVMQGG